MIWGPRPSGPKPHKALGPRSPSWERGEGGEGRGEVGRWYGLHQPKPHRAQAHVRCRWYSPPLASFLAPGGEPTHQRAIQRDHPFESRLCRRPQDPSQEMTNAKSADNANLRAQNNFKNIHNSSTDLKEIEDTHTRNTHFTTRRNGCTPLVSRRLVCNMGISTCCKLPFR